MQLMYIFLINFLALMIALCFLQIALLVSVVIQDSCISRLTI